MRDLTDPCEDHNYLCLLNCYWVRTRDGKCILRATCTNNPARLSRQCLRTGHQGAHILMPHTGWMHMRDSHTISSLTCVQHRLFTLLVVTTFVPGCNGEDVVDLPVGYAEHVPAALQALHESYPDHAYAICPGVSGFVRVTPLMVRPLVSESISPVTPTGTQALVDGGVLYAAVPSGSRSGFLYGPDGAVARLRWGNEPGGILSCEVEPLGSAAGNVPPSSLGSAALSGGGAEVIEVDEGR